MKETVKTIMVTTYKSK